MTPEINPHAPIGQREFIVLIAGIMAISALGIDAMLPALPEIGRSLHVANANTTQWVIAAYMFGFGSMQLVYGPLTDRFGRRPVLLITLAGFVFASLIAGQSRSFPLLIAARVLQGVMLASTRVLTVSILRDCYSGRAMAKISSLAQMVFFIVPILAPSVGSAIILFGPWRWIFWFLGLFAGSVALWAAMRLPETLKPEDRRAISMAMLTRSYGATLSNRYSVGYTLGSAIIFGALLGYINSSQQIFAQAFHAPRLFTIAFGCIAAVMGVTTYANSQLVERLGMRVISHSAVIALIVIALIHVTVAEAGYESMVGFVVLQALTMACFGLVASNFGAMAIEPLGHFAGTASSIQGFVSTLGAAGIGIMIGQAFDGTVVPMAFSVLSAGCATLAIVLITERGQLFTARLMPVKGVL